MVGRTVRPWAVLECVVNISEGRDLVQLRRLAEACGNDLLDIHRDPHHHRGVFTLVGETAPRALARTAVELLDLRAHTGVHPRIGVVDVVPFVPLDDATLADAIAARDRFARWVADELGVPAFCYGPERTLPEIRRNAFTDLRPDTGGPHPHPSAGAVAVGARPVLVAYNLWLRDPDLATARRTAAMLRGPAVRTLGLQVGERVQVSCNLIEPFRVGPSVVEQQVRELLQAEGNDVAGAELVGLVPREVLAQSSADTWERLDLAETRTIEARLAHRPTVDELLGG